MELTIDELKINIPNELIQKRMELFYFDTREDTIKDIRNSFSGYIKCFNTEELNNPLLNDEIFEWLNSEMQIFNPNNRLLKWCYNFLLLLCLLAFTPVFN